MTTDDDPGATPPAGPRPFSLDPEGYADPLRAAVVCTTCSQPIPDRYYELGGRLVCVPCRAAILAYHEGGSRATRLLYAAFLGAVAALGGILLATAIFLTTGRAFGLIPLLMAFMVGGAVHKGSRGRGGWGYQSVAVFLTYSAIVFSALPVAVSGWLRAVERARPATAAPLALTPRAPAEPAPGEDAGPGRLTTAHAAEQTLILLCGIVGRIYALPFRPGRDRLVPWMILAISLIEAAALNKTKRVDVRGPFPVVAPTTGRAAEGAIRQDGEGKAGRE